MAAHAVLSPSSAHRWMACHASVVMEEGVLNENSQYADEGTAAHFLAEQHLLFKAPAAESIGQRICLWERDAGDGETERGTSWESELEGDAEVTNSFVVDEEMAENVQAYIDAVHEAVGDGELLVEQRLSIEFLTGEEGAAGTSDTVGLLDTELQIHDLKYGKGYKVLAEKNKQLGIYGLSALEAYGPLAEFERVRLFIHQPRLGHISEWDCTVEELLAFGREVMGAADAIHDMRQRELQPEDFNPGEEQCKWCRAKRCPALDTLVADETGVDFDDLDQEELPAPSEDSLPNAYAKLPLIEKWCGMVKAAAQAQAEHGNLPGYKLVAGHKGNRVWADTEAAEAALKAMRLKKEVMYDFKVKSPAQVEKLLKENPRRWATMEALITQADGKPTIVKESDPRPALAGAADDFDNLEQEESHGQ